MKDNSQLINQLFYNSELNLQSKQITFDKDESRHIIRVLRKKEGDILTITNGKGYLFYVEITLANDKKCLASIIKVEEKPKPWNYHLHIAIAPTKNNDRLEWFLEKATEIGVDELTPIICQNSERKVVKPERLEKIILSAMKQSLKFRLPKLNPPVSFSQFIQQQKGKLYIAHCEHSEKTSLKHIELNDNYTILIGPEGDFSTDEIQDCKDKGCTEITLGESRLRTETAGVVAVQNIAFLHQS